VKKSHLICGTGLVLVLAAIQFIHPQQNQGPTGGPDDITSRFAVPLDAQTVLASACYDCHSNRTRYPWYAKVQPVGWWMAHHINEAKGELNFSEFGAYSAKRAARKLDAIVDQVEQGDMPLNSYTWMHPAARLTAAQRKLITGWAQTLHDKIAPE
jgi:Haem-binding domain